MRHGMVGRDSGRSMTILLGVTEFLVVEQLLVVASLRVGAKVLERVALLGVAEFLVVEEL